MLRWIVLLSTLLAGAVDAAPRAFVELDPPERAARLEADTIAVRHYREGLKSVIVYAAAQPALFAKRKPGATPLMTVEARDQMRALWQQMLDYYLALDSLRRYHSGFAQASDARERERGLLVHYGAFLAQYRYALDVLALADTDPTLDVLLNEPMPELGLPQGSFADFKLRFLNVLRATEFAALETVYRATGGRQEPALRAAIQDDAARIWKMGRGAGETMTLKNGLTIVQKTGASAFFPVQAGVAEWMGDTKVYRVADALITQEQIRSLRLEPGDILLVRREWYLSNVGLPGYWPHAALYIGNAEERARYFTDPDVQAWVRARGEASGDFERLLQRDFPKAYAASLKTQADGHVPRIMEAVSEGVSLTTLEHSAEADSLSVLRPRLTKRDKVLALWRTFFYHGRPYDFDFDFRSDATLVCTELVYKAYEPGSEGTGLRLPLVSLLGRVATPANEFVRQFDAQYDTPAQQSDLVVFLDGHEKSRSARPADIQEFRLSWQRPKWHILTQDGITQLGERH